MPTDPDVPAIELDRLVRRYGRTDAVNGLSLRVEAGRANGTSRRLPTGLDRTSFL